MRQTTKRQKTAMTKLTSRPTTKTHDLLEHPENVDAAEPPRPAASHPPLLARTPAPREAEPHQRPLPSLGIHGHAPEIALPLVLLLDHVVRRPGCLPDRLDEYRVSHPEFDVGMLRRDGVRREVHQGV